MLQVGMDIDRRQRRRWHRRQVPPWIRSSRREPAHAGCYKRAWTSTGASPKMASAPSPPSIHSSRRESAQTSSLAREQRKGKEVIRLTPDATSGHGHRQAPAPKMASAPSPASIRSSRRESAQTSSLAREQRKGKEVIRLTPDATSGHGHRQAPVRRWHRRQVPHRSVAADVSRLKLHPWPASKGREKK